jgi:hypothetical protein
LFLPALEALAQQFGLWEKLRGLPGLDPRTRTTHGYSPELVVAQLPYCFCTGGASLADAERLNTEPLVRQLARVEHFADQTQLGEWLRKQSDASIAALWQLIRQFVQWVIARADAARWTYAGRAEVFFDDTQIEVFGPSFEGTRLNYNGDRALSWQTLWLGPFLTDGDLGSPGDVSGALPQRLQQRRLSPGHCRRRLHPLERQLQQMDHGPRTHGGGFAGKRLVTGRPNPLERRHRNHRTTHPHPPHAPRQ